MAYRDGYDSDGVAIPGYEWSTPNKDQFYEHSDDEYWDMCDDEYWDMCDEPWSPEQWSPPPNDRHRDDPEPWPSDDGDYFFGQTGYPYRWSPQLWWSSPAEPPSPPPFPPNNRHRDDPEPGPSDGGYGHYSFLQKGYLYRYWCPRHPAVKQNSNGKLISGHACQRSIQDFFVREGQCTCSHFC